MLHGVISRRIHRAEKLDVGSYSMDTIQAQRALVIKIVRDQTGQAFTNDQFFDNLATSLKEAKVLKQGSPTEANEKVSGILNLNDDEEQWILDAMAGDTNIMPEDRNTAFALINGITLVEKNRSIERGMELVHGAGQVKEILKALA
jgi:hypothetical protein